MKTSVLAKALLPRLFIVVLGLMGYTQAASLNEIPEPLKEALYYASLAPSSHNAQMWKLYYSPSKSTLILVLDKTRSLTQVDPKNRESYISLGAYAKTMEEALTAYGYAPVLDIAERESEAVVIVQLQGKGGVSADQARLKGLTKRHTDKREFSKNPLKAEDLASLQKVGGGNLYYFAQGNSGYDYIGKGAVASMEIQVANQKKRNELAEWLRYSDAEKEAKKDGLPAEQLGITGLKKFFYYWLVDKKYAQGDAYAKQGVDMTRDQAENNAGFLVLTGTNAPKDLIRTGMLLQTVWLEATRHEIAIHPMSQLLEEMPYSAEIQGRLGLAKPVQMVLRLGYVSSYGGNNRIRRDLPQYLILEP